MKTAIGACLGVSAIMVWAMTWGPSSGSRTANIGDAVEESGASASPQASPATRVPKLTGDTPVVSITQGPGIDTVRYYERETGRSFEASLKTGKVQTLSEERLDGFIRSVWSPSKGDVVSVFEERNGLHFRSYNYATKQTAPIGSSATSVAYSPSGRSLSYINTQDNISTLFIAKPDGTESRTVLTTRAADVTVDWPQETQLSLFTRRPDESGSDLSLVNPDGSLLLLLANKENLEYKWSRDGQQLLFSYFLDGQGIQLQQLDTSTKMVQSLGVATSAAKCAWGRTSIIVCGVPATTSLARDITADKSATLDDILAINLVTGAQQVLYAGTKNALIGTGESFISSSGRYFVFTNIFDRRLYRLEI